MGSFFLNNYPLSNVIERNRCFRKNFRKLASIQIVLNNRINGWEPVENFNYKCKKFFREFSDGSFVQSPKFFGLRKNQIFSKVIRADFFVLPHCNPQFERMPKSTVSIEFFRSCDSIFSNNKVQIFHLCLNRQPSVYTRIFYRKIFNCVTCVKCFKVG